jgi:hypothetical protein
MKTIPIDDAMDKNVNHASIAFHFPGCGCHDDACCPVVAAESFRIPS